MNINSCFVSRRPLRPFSLICVVALLGAALRARGDFIDTFGVGPQGHALGPGDSYWSDTATELEPTQVIGGSRTLILLADADSAFRSLVQGALSANISGSAAGACTLQAAIPDPFPASSYEPGIILSYDPFRSDWSAFDRILIRFSTPPNADVTLQTSLLSADNPFWADTAVPAGSASATILFSDLAGMSSSNVTSLQFQWNLPREASLTIRDIQVVAAARPEQPRLAVSAGAGIILSWPTNATGFRLESATNISAAFTTVTNEPTVEGVNHTLTLPVLAPQTFFRLHQP